MMGVQDLQDHLDLQDLEDIPHFLDHIDPITLSVSLDLLALLVHLGAPVTLLGLQF